MKVIVCVKQTIDTEAIIEVDGHGRVIREGQTLVIDPYSEFAVERAVQLKEELGAEVTVLTIGGADTVPAIRHALSMGADSGYLIEDAGAETGDAAMKAYVLAAAIRQIGFDLVMGGCKSADTSHAQVLPRAAVLLGIPSVNVVTGLEADGDTVRATREIDDGIEVIEVALPALITAQQGLAEPRYPNVRDIMQSKKKPITTWSLADIGIDPSSLPVSRRIETVGFRVKPQRSGGRIIEGEPREAVVATVALLRSEAKVI